MAGREYDRPAMVIGLLFVVLGVVFLLDQFDVFDLRAAYVWPVALIALGAVILAGGLASRRGE